jgi:SNF2 family DNA or RNA helicase
MDYSDLIARKLSLVPPTGITGELSIPDSLFDHQRALVKWALRRGRAAIFADTGLGKSRMQLAWASEVLRHTGMPVLILAPLAVAAQTVGEGAEIGVDVRHVRDQSGVTGPAIYITNYDRLHLFDAGVFGALVLDESSCIKHHTAKTFAHLCEAFRDTPYKLCATATPAPNDWTELGTHAEFLGICTRAEMLAEYFIHDGAELRLELFVHTLGECNCKFITHVLHGFFSNFFLLLRATSAQYSLHCFHIDSPY